MKRLRLIAATVMVLALVPAPSGRAAESPWETIEWGRMNETQKFKWAIDLYRMDRADKSAEVLKRIVEANPAPPAMADMRDLLEANVRSAMIADPKTTEALQSWLNLYQSSVEKLRLDDGYIAEMVAKLTSADGSEMDLGVRRLEQLQEFAATGVCRMMAGTQKAEHRAAGRGMLLRLGRAATLPVIEHLSVKDDTLRIALLDVLGCLKDVRAQAVVVRIAKDPRTSAEVRKAANEALARIVNQPRPGLPLSNQPPVNYWWLADACLHEKPCALATMDGEQLPLWSWSDEKQAVTFRLVPRRLYNEELAEDACFDGLEIDKNDMSLRAMVIAAYYAEKLELLGAESDDVNRALDMAILVGGKQALQQCMDKAVLDRDLGIAVQAADALGAVGAGKGFTMMETIKTTNPLLSALGQEDRALRFAAARAVVSCQPKTVAAPSPLAAEGGVGGGKFDNYREVLPALSWGLMYESPSRTVLIIHPDTGVINYYKGEIRKLGHEVAEATDMASAVTCAGALPRPDVVLISADFMSAIDGLKGVLGSNRIPFVLLVPADRKEAAEKEAGGAVAGSFVDQASPEGIKMVFARVMEVPEKKLVKDLVPRISERAAVAFSQVVPAASPLPMRSAVPALKRALLSKNDAVRTPALKALGNIAADDSALEVLAVAADVKNDKTVRLAALDALAKILEAQEKVPPDVFTGLVPVSSEPDAELSLAAARAIAVAKFEPAQFTDLMVLKRVQEIKSGGKAE